MSKYTSVSILGSNFKMFYFILYALDWHLLLKL